MPAGRPKVTGFTERQIEFLLGEGPPPHHLTLSRWREDPRFIELERLIKQGRSAHITDMVSQARKIVQDALDGKVGDDDKTRVDMAMKILQRYPDVPRTTVTYKKWEAMDHRTIPEKKLRRIEEEIENDKSLKQDVLPVDHVGHTKLGSVMHRENPTDEEMLESELKRGVAEDEGEAGQVVSDGELLE